MSGDTSENWGERGWGCVSCPPVPHPGARDGCRLIFERAIETHAPGLRERK